MTEPATKEDLDELRTELRGDMAELRGDMDGLRSSLRGEMAELRTELRGGIDELRTEMRRDFATKEELRGVESRLTYLIGESASRTANVIIEHMADMVKPIDDKATQALAEARAARTEVGELRADFDRHSGDPNAH